MDHQILILTNLTLISDSNLTQEGTNFRYKSVKPTYQGLTCRNLTDVPRLTWIIIRFTPLGKVVVG